MKKIILLLITIFMIFSLSACKSAKTEENKQENEEINEVLKEINDLDSEENVEEESKENIETESSDEELEDNPILHYEYDVVQYDSDMPHRYRTVYKEMKKPDEKYDMDSSYVPSSKGLDSLKASGSAEFSEGQFESLVNDLKRLTSGPIYIVDLRQEDHLFINGESVYWNGTNEGLSSEEVMEKEEVILDALQELLPDEDIKSEKTLADEYGVNYIRIASKDNHFPSAENVEEFLELIKTLPSNAWLHFHCKEGKGRTTTFMSLYDIYRNQGVSLKDIAYRQYCLGGVFVLYDGSDLSHEDPEREFCEEREHYMYLYYDFIHRNPLKMKQKWANWLEEMDDVD